MAVIVPLEYTTRVTSTFSWQLISTVWILGALAAVPGALQIITAGSMSPWFACRNAIVSMSELEFIQMATLSTSTTSPVETFPSTDYGISLSTSPYQHVPSFILSISHSLRCWLAPISALFCMLPLIALGYMYIRIFWEASKSGRDNRRR